MKLEKVAYVSLVLIGVVTVLTFVISLKKEMDAKKAADKAANPNG